MHRVRIMLRTAPSNVSQRYKQHALSNKNNIRVLSTSTDIRPWKSAMIESHGDYRDEAFLETEIGGPLYQQQSSLPRLPIPTLQDTMARFIPTALPLAKSQEERTTLLQACALFTDQAKELQKRLEERRNVEMKDSSWLQLWWNTVGYLQVRDPVVINVSYFFQFSDDFTLSSSSPQAKNVQRGAAILTAVADFRRQVCSGAMHAETVGKAQTPLCSTAFKYMFHACRIPRRNQDSYRMYDPSRHTHCIVARKGHFFAVDFMDSKGNALSLETLEERLQQCIDMADASDGVSLGLLTSNDRDSWADAREELVRAGGIAMEEALTKLESGAILLCLDDEVSSFEGDERNVRRK